MTRRWDVDRLGAIAGTICAVHCLLTGLALGLLSVVGLEFLGSPTSEAFFVGSAVVLGVWAIIHGIRRHHSYKPSLIFVFAMGCILASHFVFGHHHGHDGAHAHSTGSTFLSVLGGLSLVAFHVTNQRLAHRCGCGCKTR